MSETIMSTLPPPTGTPRPRVLVLGGGAVVRECFAPALASLGMAGDTTIVDPVNAVPDAYPGFRLDTSDFRAVLARPDLDATHCVVALPNALHVEAVTLALRRGLHVLCEKPLSLSAEECRGLHQEAGRCQRLLGVNMVRRLFQSVQVTARALALGWVGELTSVSIAHGGAYGWPIASLAPFLPINGGVLADMGVHYLDLAHMLVGPLTPTSYSDDWQGGVESECRFQLQTAAGVPVELALSRLGPLDNEIVVEGTVGRVRLGVDTMDHAVFEPLDSTASPVQLSTSGADTATFTGYFTEQMRRFLANTVDVTADVAAQTAALMEWAYQRRPPKEADTRPPRLEPGRVLVTGGTGFIGVHLLDRLCRADTGPVTATYRSFASCASISRFPVEYAKLDLLEPGDLRALVRGHRYVFHLAVARNAETEQQVTVEGTRQLVEACIAEGVEAVVVLSTMYVMGHETGTIDETSPYKPIGGSYGSAKAAMERWLLKRARTSGQTRLSVLIPTCVYGPGGDTYTQGPISFAREGRFVWIAEGSGLANVVYVGNLVDAMVRAAVTPAAHGERFIVSDGCLSWREFLSPLLGPFAATVPSPKADEFEAMCQVVDVPAGVGDIARAILRSPEVWDAVTRTRVATQLRPLVKKYAPSVVRLRRKARPFNPAAQRPEVDRPVPPLWLREVYGPTAARFLSDKAARVLGWHPPVATADAVALTATWLEQRGFFASID